MRQRRRTVVSVVLALFATVLVSTGCTARGAAADHGAPSSPSAPLHEHILGSYSWPISTSSPGAQAYFDQGVRLMYAYATASARRSFEQARRLDPECAMCWWGEAWAHGPYLNSPMSERAAPLAYEAVQRATALANGAAPVERALIGALRSRYAPEHPSTGRRGLDSAYVHAMARVYEGFPEHPDVGTLYADAMMLLEPRRGVWPLTKPSVQRIHEVLEGVLARDIGHPGACHAYVHATETTPKVTEAQRCADLLGAAIPGVSHINHMPSHTYNRVGRWGDAVRANVEAWETDQRASRGEGIAIYPAHNLHMLLFSAAVDGQEDLSIRAAMEYSEMVTSDGVGFLALVLVRFGRLDEVLQLTTAPRHPVHEGFWAFARGLAHLRAGALDSASAYLQRVDSLALHTPESRGFRVHPPDRLVGIVGAILRGEMLRAEGHVEDAARSLQHAIHLEASLVYDEPEPLPFTPRDFLGALLLEAGQAEEAQRVYEAALEARPNNGWSLYGLWQAHVAQGNGQEGGEARVRFEQAWQRSGVELTVSRF